ncbi:MAG: hypothetical protein KAH57_01990, partial [Thermoplasmata archaeon]|nr:hypothetical protein [Thermoplasmata archaeon]
MDEIDQYTVDEVLSQGGMVKELNMRQNNVSRALNLLMTQDLIEYRTSHIKDVPRRRRVYFLSVKGRDTVEKITEELKKKFVLVRTRDRSLKEWSIGKVLDRVQQRSGKMISLYQLISDHLAGNEIDLSAMEAGIKPDRNISPFPRVVDFVGRKAELELLSNAIKDDDIRIVSMVSMAGQGKTTLLSHFLRTNREITSIWINIDSWMGIESFLRELGENLHNMGENRLYGYISSTGVIDPYTAMKKAIEDMDTGTLLVLDNIERGVPDLYSLLRGIKDSLIQGSRGAKMIISGRVRPPIVTNTEVMTRNGVIEIDLEGLDKNSVRELLSKRGLPIVDLDPIFEITKGHPMAINLYLISPEIDRGEFRHSLDRFIVEEILSTLDEDEKGVLRLASQFLIPMERAGFEYIEGLDEDVLNGFALKSLLLEYPDGSFDLHSLLKESIRDSIPEGERIKYSIRAMEHHLRRGKDEDLFQYLRLARESSLDQKFLKGLLEWGPSLIDRGYLQIGEWVEDLDPIDLKPKKAIDLKLLIFDSAMARGDVTSARTSLGQSTQICAQLMENRSSDWNLVMAKVLTRGAELAKYEGARSEMLKRYRRSLELIRMGGNRQEEAETLIRIGQAFRELGEPDVSLEYLLRSETLAKNSRNRGLLSEIFQKIGEIEYEKGHLSRSIGYMLRSVNEARKEKRGEGIPRALRVAGWIYRDVGEMDRAAAYLTRSIHGYIEKRDLRSVERTSLDLLSVLSGKGEKHAISEITSTRRDIEKIPYSPRINSERKQVLIGMYCAIQSVLKGNSKVIKRNAVDYFSSLEKISSREDYIGTFITIS